jgi:hypothetical protein
MVARGFPQIRRAQSHKFLSLQVSPEGRMIQRVLVTGSGGGIVVARYEMVEVDGAWRINGCTLESATDA